MSNWKEYKLGEIADVRDGTHDSPKQKQIGKPLVTSKHIKGGTIDLSSAYLISIEDFDKINKRSKVDKWDLLFSMIGTIGEMVIVQESTDFAIKNVGLFKTGNEYLSKWIYYYLKSPNAQNEIAASLKGSTQQYISLTDLRNFPIILPPENDGRRIIEILSSLDDKIELNNKINQELENLAQTLFKRWFIDFEFPVSLNHDSLDLHDEQDFKTNKKAKNQGNQENPKNHGSDTYRSSGGEMVDSELGEIPKGWEVYSMSDLLETVSKTYPLKAVEEVIFLNTGDIHDGKFLHNNLSNSKTLPGQAKKSISKNDILYSEIRPANKRFAFVHFDASKYVVSTKLMVMRSKVNISSLFQYFILTQKEQIDYLQRLAESRSGTFPQITFTEVSTIKIALPSFELVNQFVENVLSPFFENKFNSEYENQELTNLRDTLLPKLISGELEVNRLNLDLED